MSPGHGQREVPGEQPETAEEEFRTSGSWVKLIGDFLGPGGRPTPDGRIGQISGRGEGLLRGFCEQWDRASADGVMALRHR
jgi:hypothetical protein